MDQSVGKDPHALHRHFVATARAIAQPLHQAILRVGPVTLPRRDRTAFGLFLGRAIVGQQLSPAAAGTIWTRIERAAAEAGEGIPGFFRPENAECVRGCGVSRAKLRALMGIAEADASGSIDARLLRALDHGSRAERLLALPGVGPWTCDMVSLFYFRAPDIWPEGDLAVQRTFRRLIGRRSPDRAAARFAPFRSHLAVAMWRLVDLERKGG